VSENQTAQAERPAGSEEELAQAKEFLSLLLEKMQLQGGISAKNTEDAYVLDIDCEDDEDLHKLTGRRGQLLDAIQHLVSKSLARERKDRGRSVVVDAGGYRAKHIERLEDLAARMADKTRDSGELVRLNPMNPFDRRIVHMALAELADVRTESEGEGEDRHVVVHPA